MARDVKPFGTWPSALSSARLVSTSVRLSQPSYDGDTIYWVETRPLESGRAVVVARDRDGEARDVLPAGFSARTLVHEYGGRSYVARGGVLFFCNHEDQRLYRVEPGEAPRALTPEPPSPRAWRYAEPTLTPDGGHLICVRERHDESGVTNDLVLVDALYEATPRTIAEGHDFYAAPTLNDDASLLAYLTWDLPQMPWDGTELHLVELEDLAPRSARVVAGGPNESVLEPRFVGRDQLIFASDRTGWWNLYLDRGGESLPLAPAAAEFAGPLWNLGTSWYDSLADHSIVASWFDSSSHLGVISLDGGRREIPGPWTSISFVAAGGNRVLVLGGSAEIAPALFEVDVASGDVAIVKESQPRELDPEDISLAEAFEFPTSGGLFAHAYYYAPTSRDFAGPKEELPPLIVSSHGGPTGQASSVLNYEVQFWTSRGFAFVDVNYGGSTGYGRAYRDRLKGNWGVVDVEDCVNAARHLVSINKADPKRLLIRGGSAGGYTTLCVLTTYALFAGAACYYGIAELTGFAEDTHKFESRYVDQLIGPWPASKDLYLSRSPIEHAERLRTPVILFQGLDDPVVPPSQSEVLVRALEANAVPYAYLAFAGEGHGFRQAATIIRAADAELAFYGRALGFSPAGEPVELEIHHADALKGH